MIVCTCVLIVVCPKSQNTQHISDVWAMGYIIDEKAFFMLSMKFLLDKITVDNVMPSS